MEVSFRCGRMYPSAPCLVDGAFSGPIALRSDMLLSLGLKALRNGIANVLRTVALDKETDTSAFTSCQSVKTCLSWKLRDSIFLFRTAAIDIKVHFTLAASVGPAAATYSEAKPASTSRTSTPIRH